jgi:hypothetical protein
MLSSMSADARPIIRLWCVTASDAPVVAVIARLITPDGRWSHILKWDYKRAYLQPGVWSRLDIKAHRCRLSPDGQFIMYTAKGPLGGPFDASFGGGIAISRLPWLAALTFIHPASVGGGGPSRDMLARDQQEQLWKLFEEPYYFMDEDWLAHLGREWLPAEPAIVESILPRIVGGGGPAWRLARLPLVGRDMDLLALAKREDPLGEPVRHARYHLYDPKADLLHPLPGLHCAVPTSEPRARILATTRDGHLQLLTPHSTPGPEVRAAQDHDLSALMPDPKPAPNWARAPL